MIHVFDNDHRQVTDKENYPLNHGSFSEVAIQMNKALKNLGYYADAEDAEFVGTCDGLNVGFYYNGKPSFVLHVWEASSLPVFVRDTVLNYYQRIFGLSNQITNLWKKHGFPNVKTVYGGCDYDFWKPTIPQNINHFQFCHVNSSNVRSGLDLTLNAFARAFSGDKDTILVVKDTNVQKPDSKLVSKIKELNDFYKCSIYYWDERLPATFIRDLYSQSQVTLNLLRATSFGMPLLDSTACGSLCVTGDIAPTNELIKSPHGILVPAKGEIYLDEVIKYCTEEWGLLNCYGSFTHVERPKIADFDVTTYMDTLINVRKNYKDLLNKDNRNYIINNWGWERSAQSLIDNLYGK